MQNKQNQNDLIGLIHELRKLPKETEWVEFKHNNAKPEQIGEYISSLSNSAAFCGKAHGYLIWGIENDSHEMMGTSFSPTQAKAGNEELKSWLLRLLSPKLSFCFYEILINEKKVVLLEVPRAFRHPVQFKKQEYFRVGSCQKRLKDFPEKEKELWRIFDETPFEDQLAAENIHREEVLKLLDYAAYFELLRRPLPESNESIFHQLKEDRMICPTENGGWNITNLGAILFAKKLAEFRWLRRKAVRVIRYSDHSRVNALQEREGSIGYACGFKGIITFINQLLPVAEVIEKDIRKTVPMYPELAVRELVANALIHQDFQMTGTGPMVEIFEKRVEITNPGKPLVETQRFLDTSPHSRNEALASFMRRIGICEERGSGVDKVVSETERYQLPAPSFETSGDHTRAILYAYRPFSKMEKEDRIRACYLHACLQYVNHDVDHEFMTNRSLRKRFGITEKNSAMVSRVIKETNEAKLIRPYNSEASRKLMKYVPFWG